MLDFRYHIFYLGLMFLMLGFGIFVGASVIGPAQVRQQSRSIASLRVEALAVVQDRDAARDRLGKEEAALASLRPMLVRGKLAGKRVVLIQTGDSAAATEAANTALGDAGAGVAATVVLTGKWATLGQKSRAALAGSPEDPAAQNAALLSSLASGLVLGTGGGHAAAQTLEALQRQGLVTVSGDLSQPCGLFVLVGGSSDDAPHADLDTPILAGFGSVSSPVTVVGCEALDTAASSVPAYQAAGIATVDCVDLPLGQLALPFALRGDKGDYGLKPTARQPLPDTLGGAPSP